MAHKLPDMMLRMLMQQSREENAPIGKSMGEAQLLREQGNAAYARQDLPEALRKYTRSIATGPCDGDTTDLALAFANRSAVHFSLGNYEDCLSDIEQAFKVNYPSRLRYKVLKRRAECRRAMGNMEAARKNMEEAISCCLEEDKKRSMEQELAALKPPEQVYKPRLRVRPPPEKYLGDNPMLPGASACLEIKYNEKYGRHLVATQDIPPGAVLIVEQPIASTVYSDKCDDYCFRCMRRCSAMIPCKSCTIAMYCSESCRESSWSESHDLECSIRAQIADAFRSKLPVIVLRLFFVSLKKYGDLQQLYDYVTQLDSEKGSSVFDAKGRYDPTDLRAVYNLAQSKVKSVYDQYAECCAFLVENIAYYSGLFSRHDYTVNEYSLKWFTKRLLKRYMRILLINAFEVQDWADEDREIGSAIYPVFSLINHRCISNAAQYPHGNTAVMLTTLPIEKGEQVFISYGAENIDIPRADAESLNMESWYGFKCDCRGCTNPLPDWTVLPLCPKCRTVVNCTPEQEMVKCPQCFQRFNAVNIIYAALGLINTAEQLWSRPLKLANVPKICEIITKLHRTVALSHKILNEIQSLLPRTLTLAALDAAN